MTTQNLKRILSAKGEAATIVYDIMCAIDAPIGVWNAESELLFGAACTGPEDLVNRHSILCDGAIVGWTSGEVQAEQLAALLTYLVAREAEKEELLDEILDLYRQVNLLFNLSDKLSASLEVDAIAQTTLDEASRLIAATDGAVILFSEEQDPQPVARMGQAMPAQLDDGSHVGLMGTVVGGARAEIINDVCSDPRYVVGRDTMRSMLCAPLMSNNRAMGAIVIGSLVPVTYTAADLNLLNTLASQAAPAIENALAHEKALREAQQREEQLRRQVLELRIELDEARQKEKVAEITSSEYYQRLRDRADTLRSIIDGPRDP